MKTKREFKFFTIMEYEKEQLYLQKKHKEGWKLIDITGIGMYHFEKCEPEDIVYQLDYNQEGISHKDEYVQMFNDCGWEYIMDFVGYSYFRKPVCEMNGDERIFCDDLSRLEMIQRIFKGRMIPLLVIFFACLVPQFIVQLIFNRLLNILIASIIGILIIIYLCIFAHYAITYVTYKNKLGK